MRKLITTLIVSSVLLTAARADNATAGANVTLNGGTFFTGNDGWSLGPNAAPNDLVNGVYQSDGHQWNFDSVWWNGFSNPANNIVIMLTGSFLISDLKIQADNNDSYHVEYYGTDSAWHNAWDVYAPNAGGLSTSSTMVGVPFVTDAFRLTATTAADFYYSVSQFEATGQKAGGAKSVPESGLTIALWGAALGLLGIARRFIRA